MKKILFQKIAVYFLIFFISFNIILSLAFFSMSIVINQKINNVNKLRILINSAIRTENPIININKVANTNNSNQRVNSPILLPFKSVIHYTKSIYNSLIIDLSNSYDFKNIMSYEWDINNDGIYEYKNSTGVLAIKEPQAFKLFECNDSLVIGVKVTNDIGFTNSDRIVVTLSDNVFYLTDSINLHISYCKLLIFNKDISYYHPDDYIFKQLIKKTKSFDVDFDLDGKYEIMNSSEVDITNFLPTQKDVLKIFIRFNLENDAVKNEKEYGTYVYYFNKE